MPSASHPWKIRPGRVNVKCAHCGAQISRRISKVRHKNTYCRRCLPLAQGWKSSSYTVLVAPPGLPAVEAGPAWVRAARRLLGLTQRDLARKAGVSERSLGDYERGQAVCLPQRRAALTAALQLGGIEFTPEGPVLKSPPTQDSVEASESQSKNPALRSQL